MNSSKSWIRRREGALKRLREHFRQGLVDPDIADLLDGINRLPCVFTTSSCSGRLVILESEGFTEKRGSKKLWVEHDPQGCLNVCSVIERIMESGGSSGRLVWVSLQPPVLHLYARSESIALNIVRCARESGFVRACYRREDAMYFVEVSVHDKIHIAIPAPCETLRALCDVLARYKRRLKRLKECLLAMSCEEAMLNSGHPVQPGPGA